LRAIPLVVVEEHHEAFFAWHKAAAEGSLPIGATTLLHVDEHSDMSVPRLRRPLPPPTDLEAIADCTYEDLDIGNFVWPAVYQGLFNRVLWLRHKHKGGVAWSEMSICAKTPAGLEFVTGRLDGTAWGEAPDRRRMEFAQIHPGDLIRTDQPVVLDVDLDYFCSNDYPDYQGRQLEVSEAAFRDFRENPYHFLRIAPGSRISAFERDGRFYLRFNDYPEAPGRTSTPGEIPGRIAALAQQLRENEVQPVQIIFCRSAESGYMPRDVLGQIEQGLLEALRELWPLRVQPIHELLPARWRSRTLAQLAVGAQP
jgi:hypothetical protein